MDHPLYLLGALGDFTAVVVHGVVGHRIVIAPLRDRLFATAGFGDEDMTWRILNVSWQLVTAAFFCSGVLLLLAGLGVVDAPRAPRFVALLHGSFIAVALAIVGRRVPVALPRPVPVAFFSVLTMVTLTAWLG